jgi:hypothetical protein
MYKAAVITLSVLLVLLLSLTGIFLFLFSPSGDAVLKPYLQKEIESKIHMPVEVRTYHLRAGVVELELLIDRKLQLHTKATYDLLSGSFRGRYRIKADHFRYEDRVLKQADIKGSYHGVAEDIFVEGKGRALDAPIAYKLRVIDSLPQQIEAVMKGVPLTEVLQLAKQPPLATGRMDVVINMPRIGNRGAKGTAHIMLKEALLNTELIAKDYGTQLPKGSRVYADGKAWLDGDEITFGANVKSALFALDVKKGTFRLSEKRLSCDYLLDIKTLRVLTQNRLSGPLKMQGAVRYSNKGMRVTAQTDSLGGTLRLTHAKETTVTLQDLSVKKILLLLNQPHYLDGLLNGSIKITDMERLKGVYDLQITKGDIDTRVVYKELGYTLPKKSVLKLYTKGEIENGLLQADTKLVSTIADLVLHRTEFKLDTGDLRTPYRLTIHDIGLLRGEKIQKGRSVAVEGDLSYGKNSAVSGKVKGLGKEVSFAYKGISASLDALGMQIEKVLVLAGLPPYLKGNIDTDIKIKNLLVMNGRFSLKGEHLVTQPEAMRKLLGKPAKMPLSIDAKGVLKYHKAYADASVRLPLGTFKLQKIVSDLQKGTLQAHYHAKIPDLTKLLQVSDVRLFGSLVLDGEIRKYQTVQITGETASLGGKVTYRLDGDWLRTEIKEVPLPNILKLTGNPESFLGSVTGEARYNVKKATGTASLQIGSFQIKPSTLTEMLKPVLGKDPARIIFRTTRFDAKIDRGHISYTLKAKGSYSAIEITEGRLDTLTKRQSGRLKFVYGKYTVYGKIGGTTENPKITLDTEAIIKEKLQEKLQKKVEKKWGKEAGALLKGLGL